MIERKGVRAESQGCRLQFPRLARSAKILFPSASLRLRVSARKYHCGCAAREKGERHSLEDTKDFAPFASFFLRAFA